MADVPVGSERLFSEASDALSRLAGHRKVLEAMALRLPLSEVLSRLTEMLESAAHDTYCSVLLAEGESLRLGAAPNLPTSFMSESFRLPIMDGMGSCGTAAYSRQTVIVADISTSPLWKGMAAKHALSNGLAACWSTPILDGDGRVLGTFAQYSSVAREPAQEEVRILEDARDLASAAIQMAQSEEALQQAQDKLLYAQRLEVMGRMAGGIAHEFNNLLTVIGGNVSLAIPLTETGSTVQGVLLDAMDASGRASVLARQLLTFSRQEPFLTNSLDLCVLIRDLLPSMKRVLGSHVELETAIHEESCIVMADRSQLEQVFLTLAVNAADAMPDGGLCNVELRLEELNEQQSAVWGLSAGSYVHVEFKDSGKGLEESMRESLFEPFAKAVVESTGMGLGMPTLKSIVLRHGGSVRVDSSPGVGTTIHMHFPSGNVGLAEPLESAVKPQSRIDRGAILLVEDEAAVRRMTSRVLSSGGYTVFEAADGVSAMQLWEQHADLISAVVTDVMMPRMSGPVLVEKLRIERPDLPALFCSGYMDSADFPFSDSDGGMTLFLAKPFTVQSFIDSVDRMLS